MNRTHGRVIAAAIFAAIVIASQPVHATTKGLNQIVTPDIQPLGALSLSYQQEDPTIGNREEFQSELGITNNFEVAVFQGTAPSEQIANAEFGLYAKGDYLLSTGFLNWSTTGTAPQPYLEGGYYQGNFELIGGAINVVDQTTGAAGSIRNVHSTQALLGVAYRPTPRLQVQADYQGGAGNFSTAGFTYSVTPSLTFNPAIYASNSTPTKCYGYAVLTWTIEAFKPKHAPTAASPTQPLAPNVPSAPATPASPSNK